MCGAVDSERHYRFRQDSLSSYTTFMSTDDKSVDTCHNGVHPHFVLGYSHYVTDQLQKNFVCGRSIFPLYNEHFFLDGAMSGDSVWPYTYRLTAIHCANTER